MKKLSETQRAMLTRMADGAEIRTISGRGYHSYYWKNSHGETANTNTLWSLRKRKLVEMYTPEGNARGSDPDWRITEAGREAARVPSHA